MKKYIFSLILLFSLCISVQASIFVSLQLDRTNTSLSDTVTLVLKIEGSRQSVSPQIRGLNNFTVESGGSSSYFNMINGKLSSGINTTYYLIPRKPGQFIIGPAEVKVDGRKYTSNQVVLEVKKSNKAARSSEPIFMKAFLSKSKGYIGEEFFYTLKFYSDQVVRDLALILPQDENFSLNQLGKPSEYISTINSKQYRVVEIKYSLNINKPGEFNLIQSIMKMKIVENRRQRRGFGGFFDDDFFSSAFSSTRPFSVSSNAVHLLVKSLPENGQPSDFTGLVGKFDIKASLSPDKVPAGESSTLSVIVKGKGNIHLIPDLKLPDLQDVKTYGDQPVLNSETTKAGLAGVKTMKWALVPQKEGEITISGLSLSYFDPEDEKYKRLTTTQLNLKVIPGQKQELVALSHLDNISTPLKKEVKFSNRDILPIHNSPKTIMVSSLNKATFLHKALLIFLPPGIFLLISFFQVYKGVNNKKTLIVKKAAARFYNNLKPLNQPDQIPDILKAFNIYLNERMKLGGGSLSSEEAENELIKRGVKKDLALTIKKIILELEACVYAGHQGDIKNLKISLIESVKKINKVIKS
ncbi:BatD protein [Candidatus Magnetomoraceae bacterium gMMP-15]